MLHTAEKMQEICVLHSSHTTKKFIIHRHTKHLYVNKLNDNHMEYIRLQERQNFIRRKRKRECLMGMANI